LLELTALSNCSNCTDNNWQPLAKPQTVAQVNYKGLGKNMPAILQSLKLSVAPFANHLPPLS